MLFAHVAVGMAAKPITPRASLGALMLAGTAIDVLCGVFVLAGVERGDPSGVLSIPWSHGLLMAGVWSLAGLGLAWLVYRERRTAALLGLLVFSHWVLDWISHPMGMGRELPPDLPLLLEGSPRVGLGLYTSIPAALITELGLFVAGIAIYLRSTRARDRLGRWSVWLVVVALFAGAALAAVPQLSGLAILSLALLLPLGNWVERHREPATARWAPARTVH